MNPFSHTGLSISDSLKSVRKSVLIYETIISWLISFSASIFSLPVIFVIYNLYVSALEKHTQEKISQKINNNVIKVFAQFIYFTEYFYYKLENEKNGDEESLNNILKYSEKGVCESFSVNGILRSSMIKYKIIGGLILWQEKRNRYTKYK